MHLDRLLEAIRRGDFDLALAPLANRTTPQDDLRRLGDIVQRAGHHRDAVTCYDAALQYSPPPREAVFNRAQALKALGDIEGAIAGFETADPLFSDNNVVVRILGEIYIAQARFDEAIVTFDRALLRREDWVLRYLRNKAALARDNRLDDPAAVFGAIYEHRAWGRDPNLQFFSGEGSHAPQTVQPYVDAVTGFLDSLDTKPDVVDVGCGDFNIGSQIRGHCGRYQALDVVPALIDHNRTAFAGLSVEFGVLDVTRDPIPECDVLFIREVFQHLSNAQITRALANIAGRYRYLVFTDVEPPAAFTPNKDKLSGENVRAHLNFSAVRLTEPPFSVAFSNERVLCTVERPGSLVRTRLYTAA